MKRLLFASLLLALGSTCAPTPGPLYISRLYRGDLTCVAKPADKNFMYQGTLDVAPGSARYYLAIQVAGAENLTSAPLDTTAGVKLEPANRERIVLDQLVINYSSPKLRGFKEWVQPVNFIMDAKELAIAYGVFQLISPQAAQILDGLPASNDPADRTTLNVSLEFRGHTTGTNSALTTGKTTYPIQVLRSELGTCTSAYQSVLEGSPCFYPGMEGGTLVCCDGTPGIAGCP